MQRSLVHCRLPNAAAAAAAAQGTALEVVAVALEGTIELVVMHTIESRTVLLWRDECW